jgi:hypothetical protein
MRTLLTQAGVIALVEHRLPILAIRITTAHAEPTASQEVRLRARPQRANQGWTVEDQRRPAPLLEQPGVTTAITPFPPAAILWASPKCPRDRPRA